MTKQHILIVSAHALAREALGALFLQRGVADTVVDTHDVEHALAILRRQAPRTSVVVVAGDHLVGTIGKIVALPSPPAVVILARDCSSARVSAAIEAGARAFLSEQAETSELLSALKAVRKGRFYLCARVTHSFLKTHIEPGRPGRMSELARRVSARERQVLGLISQGKTDRQIAAILELSVATVHTHRKNIMRKLGVHNASALVRHALRLGLIEV